LSEVVKTKVARVNNAKVTETPEWRRKLFVNVSKQEFVNFRLNAYSQSDTLLSRWRQTSIVCRPSVPPVYDGHASVVTVTLCYSVASIVVYLWRYVLRLNGYYWQPIGSRIWEIDWYQNEWPWPLFRGRIKVMSTIALHSTTNISETVIDRGLVPKEHQ